MFGPASGDDHVTDFAKKDVIAIIGVAGVDDFGDLTIVNVGGSAVISWGTGDSVTLDGYRASKLSAADFSFAASAPLTAFAAMPGDLHGPTPTSGCSDKDLRKLNISRQPGSARAHTRSCRRGA